MSVVLATYQRRDLTQGAVESVLAQTYRHFELVVVDDGSTDGTGDSLAVFGDAIRYLWQPNAGVSAARNAGVKIARGDLVAFLDSDDRWLPEHLTVVTDVLVAKPECVLVSTCPCFSLSGDEPAETAVVVEPLPRLFIDNFVGFPTCVAVRREEILAIGGFDERLRHFDASDMYLRLALRGPFALLRRRTVIRHETASSNSALGRRLGLYLTSHELSARRLVEEVERSPRSSTSLKAEAEGNLQFALALQVLSDGDREAFRSAIARACLLLPQLSREPALVRRRLLYYLPHMGDARAVVRIFGDAAWGWPEPRSPTALALWGSAVRLALRAGRPGVAARLLRQAPLRPVLFFEARRLVRPRATGSCA